MKLVDTFADIFGQLQDLFGVNEQCKAYDYLQLAKYIEDLLAQQEILAVNAGYDIEAISSARFALFALIDEQVLASDWDGASQWRSNLLQKEYFATVRGGVEFFERLQELNPFKPLERDIREVYYYCLALGFKGQYYRAEDEATLRNIVNSNFDVLSEAPKERLYPLAYEMDEEEIRIPTSPINWRPVWVSGPILAWVAFYFHSKAAVVVEVQKLMVGL